MKVLILGAKGMLGQELMKEFSVSGKYDVIGYDKEDIDITNFAAVEKKIAEINPELVVNAVAINAVDKIEESPEFFEEAMRVNADAAGNLARLCAPLNCTFVHYSSDYVFDGTKQDGYTEDALLSPINKYGETKARGEKLVIEAGGNYYIIRLSKLFGKPAASVGAKKSFVDTMLYLATTEGKTNFDVVDEEVSSPTYAPDVARFTKGLVVSGQEFGVYHGANTGACSWYEWAKEIFKQKGLAVTINAVPGGVYPRPAKRPLYSHLINTKLPGQRTWQAALKDFLASY